MHRHLAILRDDHLGDMILTTPLVHTLTSAGWEVTVVGKKSWSGVWDHFPHTRYQALEELAPDYPRHWRPISRWLRQLSPTHVLVPYYKPQLLWASFFSGLGNRYCQMGRVLGRLTLHHCLRSNILHTQRHMGEVWQDFAEVLGVPRQSPRPRLLLGAEEKADMARRLVAELPGSQPLVVIHPFHGGSSCHLSLAGYAEIARLLQQSGRCRIVITGTAKEKEKWLQAAPDLPRENLWVTCGALTLRELFVLIGQSQWIVCGSTGVLHVASALDIPSVSAMCPHPLVSPDLWRNLATNAVDLSPDREHCERYHNEAVGDCGFRHGPTPQAVAQAILDRVGS